VGAKGLSRVGQSHRGETKVLGGSQSGREGIETKNNGGEDREKTKKTGKNPARCRKVQTETLWAGRRQDTIRGSVNREEGEGRRFLRRRTALGENKKHGGEKSEEGIFGSVRSGTRFKRRKGGTKEIDWGPRAGGGTRQRVAKGGRGKQK